MSQAGKQCGREENNVEAKAIKRSLETEEINVVNRKITWLQVFFFIENNVVTRGIILSLGL